MYKQLITNEEQFVKRIVTEKYSNKYDQFKRRLLKLRAKERERDGFEDEDSPAKIEDVPVIAAKEEAYQSPVPVIKRKPWILPQLPTMPQCYCRREVKNIDNAIICLTGIDRCPYGGYFHTSCIRKFDYKVVAKEGMKYYCKVCKRLGSEESAKLSRIRRSATTTNASEHSSDSLPEKLKALS